jgi:2-isopropylmalate synthase
LNKKNANNEGSTGVACTARLTIDGVAREIHAQGNGPIDAFVQALNQSDLASFKVISYTEHSLSQGAEAQAAAYVQIETVNQQRFFGAATDTNIEMASMKAVVSALNRAL